RPEDQPDGPVGLRRDRLAFVARQGTLDVYATGSGRLVHRFPVPPGSGPRVALDYGYAVYRAPRALRLVKLSTGRDVVVARGAIGPFQLGARGLVYATSAHDTSRLHVVPLARLATAARPAR